MPEQYIEIQSANSTLSAILHSTTANQIAANIGVLIIVGGPQYRVGSHRQFIKLSRHLATYNIPSLRLDCSGMGDSSGDKAEFYQQTSDINAGIDAMFKQLPQLKQVILWGLCDAASAILLKVNQPDPRIAGLILLNPWVRQQHSHAQTMLKHYYLKRLFSQQFWRKLFTGGIALGASITELQQTIRQRKEEQSAQVAIFETATEQNYVQLMLSGWLKFTGKVLVLTSGNDLTAQEFLQLCSTDIAWSSCLAQAQHFPIADANHTFSNQFFRQQVEQASLKFVRDLHDFITTAD